MTNQTIPVSRPCIGERELQYVAEAVRSGWVSSLGPFIDSFEREFAAYCGVEYAVATSNGTTGLHLALAALGIGPGDEVLVPDLTFVATANAVAYTGATPIPVDIDPDTLCISPEDMVRAIGPRTRAVVPVHLYGHPADMDAINAVAAKHGLYVVEDAAEAHGAEYKGKRVGALGHCAVFSFYGNKIITCGEGGVLTTNDRRLYERARMLRDHAMSPTRRYWHDEIGYNYRMTNLQAALGAAQLQQIEEFIEQRARILDAYRAAIRTSRSVRLNPVSPWGRSVCWMVCLEVDDFDERARDEFIAMLRAKRIDSRPYFHTISSLPMYRCEPKPAAALKSRIGLNLPTFVGLTPQQVQYIGDTINAALASRGST